MQWSDLAPSLVRDGDPPLLRSPARDILNQAERRMRHLWGPLELTSEACRNRRDIIRIRRLLPDRIMSLVCPPASYVEERQHRLGRRSLRARDLSDHRHARPVSIASEGFVAWES